MADTKFTSKWTGTEIDSGINIARNLTATGNIVITTTGSDDTKDRVVTIGTTASAAFTDITAGTADITNISCTGITAGTADITNTLKVNTIYIGASSTTGVNLTNQNNTGILNINLPSSSGTLALKSDIVPVPSSIVNSIGGVSGDVELGDGVVFSDGKLTSLVYYQYALEISAPYQGIIVHGSFISFASHEVGEDINSDTLKNLINGGLHIGSIFINDVYRGNCYIDVDSTSNDVTVTIPNTADEAITYILNNVSTTISGKSQLNI